MKQLCNKDKNNTSEEFQKNQQQYLINFIPALLTGYYTFKKKPFLNIIMYLNDNSVLNKFI